MNCQIRNCSEGAQIDFLRHSLLGIAWPWRHKGCEVADPMDFIPWKTRSAKSGKVYSAMWFLADAAVVEIESVDLNVWLEGHEKQKPQDYSPQPRAPRPKPRGGYTGK